MKILKIFLVLCIAHVVISYGMDREQPSLWYLFPKDLVIKIVACCDLNTKENLRYVNKQLFLISSKANIKNMIHHFPCILSRQDHLDCMVDYAKQNQHDMVQRLVKTARYCNHTDLLDVIPYFLPEDVPELITLKDCDASCSEHVLKELLPCIMAVYAGKKEELEQYKMKYAQFPKHTAVIRWIDIELEKYRHEITPLHVAVIGDHPISIAQLLLSQNQGLLNAEDSHYAGETPLIMAICHKNIGMCKFLLSCKNIDFNRPDLMSNTPLNEAYSIPKRELATHIPLNVAYEAGCLEIVKLLTDYKAKGYGTWYSAIRSGHADIAKFLLDSVSPSQVSELALRMFRECCDLHTRKTKIAKMLLENFNVDINATSDITFQEYFRNGKSKLFTVSGCTLLYLAARGGSYELVELLLNNGADPDIADNQGRKPIDVTSLDEIKRLLSAKMK